MDNKTHTGETGMWMDLASKPIFHYGFWNLEHNMLV